MCRRLIVQTRQAGLIALLLCVVLATTPVIGGSGSRIEGLVIGLDGRAAVDHRIHLIDSAGEPLAQADVAPDGRYAFAGLGGGEYSLGVELPNGTLARVAAPPVELGSNQLARRDVKLMNADAMAENGTLEANYGLGQWWAGLTKPAKAWTVVAVIIAGAMIYDALDDEPTASIDGSGG
jgi:hypothetical protein